MYDYYNTTEPGFFNWSNSTKVELDIQIKPAPRWVLVCLTMVPIWILFGNLLVLLAVFWNKHLRTLSNCVIASLAATDLMLAVLVVPLGTYHMVNGSWDLGLIPCLVWTGSDVMLSTASILHLGAIAIHRYLGISYPIHFRNNANNRHIITLLVPVWCIAIVISLPLIIQGIHNREHVLIDLNEFGMQCGIFDHVFLIYSSMVSFFVPLVIMVFADVRSVLILRKTSKAAIQANRFRSRQSARSLPNSSNGCNKKSNAGSTSDQTSGNSLSTQWQMMEIRSCPSTPDPERVSCHSSPTNITTPGSESELSHQLVQHNSRPQRSTTTCSRAYCSSLSARGMVKLNSRERRAEKTLIWVLVCFVALWLPFFCTNLAYGICRSCEIPPDLFMSFAWLGYISSGVNPCIYTFLNKDFRLAFKQILFCRSSRRHRGQMLSYCVRRYTHGNGKTDGAH